MGNCIDRKEASTTTVNCENLRRALNLSHSRKKNKYQADLRRLSYDLRGNTKEEMLKTIVLNQQIFNARLNSNKQSLTRTSTLEES
ncbi:unnamed protein product [Blepharisma stoltei]|uniref:Uncharacterized protein n=1 Tax=Blepharisma stoltei TaxID=1481888 RepID=A0AAU9J384_9CILI|nr:unnamed protein product [Blepharisma stoltei]